MMSKVYFILLGIMRDCGVSIAAERILVVTGTFFPFIALGREICYILLRSIRVFKKRRSSVMITRLVFPVAIIGLVVAISCSGGNAPVTPDLSGRVISSGESRSLWGFWEISIDTSTMRVSTVPLRDAQYTVDVVKFLQKPTGNPANLSIKVTDATKWISEGRIKVDVGLRHPFPGLDMYTGFDVMGLFVAPGTVSGKYDPDIKYTNGGDEPILENADGYSRWMNPSEFPSNGKIFAFIPGYLGNKNTGLFTSTINGYKYFADGLEKDGSVAEFLIDTSNRGDFKPGSLNEREYDLKFPLVSGLPNLVFQYAVVASWVEPDKTLSGDPGVLDVPGDFPQSANLSEAVCLNITDNSSLYYKDGSGGGDIKLSLEIFDWGALNSNVSDQIYQVILENYNGIIPGGYKTFDQTWLKSVAAPGTSISSVYDIDITDCTPSSTGSAPILITVESSTPDKFDPGTGNTTITDRLAAYYLHSTNVAGDIPSQITLTSPNGGESWIADEHHDITWTTQNYTGKIKLEYSKDGFVTDIHEIVASTDDTGSFDWPVPDDPSTTVRVRATLTDMPSVYDDSDADFEIVYVPDLELDAVRNDYNPISTSPMATYIDYIKLDWPDITGAQEYAVYRSDLWADPYVWEEIGTTSPAVTEFKNLHTPPVPDPWVPTKPAEFPNMGWDQDYIYEVRARSVAGDPSSEFLTTQRALVIMETNDNITEDSASWIFRNGLNGYQGFWGGNWNCDEYYIFKVAMYFFNFTKYIEAWGIVLCPNAIPDLPGQTVSYIDYAVSNGPYGSVYYVPPENGWAPGTMSAIPTSDVATCFDFDPAPDSGYLLGDAYHSEFKQVTFEKEFGEANGGFTSNHYPFKATRYAIPELLEDGVDYVGIGLAAYNSAIYDMNSAYVGLDSVAVVVY